jgi:hypothetical protein
MWDSTDPTEVSAPPEPPRHSDRLILIAGALALICGWLLAYSWATGS